MLRRLMNRAMSLSSSLCYMPATFCGRTASTASSRLSPRWSSGETCTVNLRDVSLPLDFLLHDVADQSEHDTEISHELEIWVTLCVVALLHQIN